jgi:uncharacterized membrane protein
MSRVDGFSDVVFGFALTLLVVSLEVPKSYGELHELIRGFIPFAVSFVLLMTIWYAHFQFFRRFGLHDMGTIVLNAALLFVVLFYVYPLKFLFSLTLNQMMGIDTSSQIDAQHGPELMLVYGLGFAAIYLLIAALYWNGWRQRRELGLSPLEEALTRIYVLDNAAMAMVGLFSCLLAVLLPVRLAGIAGYIYLLIGVPKTFFGFYTRRTMRAAEAAQEQAPTGDARLES